MPFDVNIISYKLVILIFYMGVYDCSVMEVLFLWSVEYRAPQCQTIRSICCISMCILTFPLYYRCARIRYSAKNMNWNIESVSFCKFCEYLLVTAGQIYPIWEHCRVLIKNSGKESIIRPLPT